MSVDTTTATDSETATRQPSTGAGPAATPKVRPVTVPVRTADQGAAPLPVAETDDDVPLTANKDFLRVWAGETVSLMGTQVTQLALPLVAILTLQATAFDIALVNASRYIPVVFVSLFAGVWLDRRRRRPVLIASNLGRAALISMIPLAQVLGVLSIWLLCVVCLLIGTLTVIFDVGVLSYLPSLVERRHLAESNGKMQTSFSLAGIIGPGAGGLLVGLISAPITLLVDSVSFVVSAVMLGSVRKPEVPPTTGADKTPMWVAIKEGLRTVFGTPLLRALLTQSATYNLFQNMLLTVFLVYGVRVLGLSTVQLGLVMGAMSVGALAGATVSHKFTKAVGFGRTLRVTTVAVALAPLLLVLPQGSSIASMAVLMTVHLVLGFNLVIYNVNTVTLRQIVTPNRLLARMNASYRLVLFGTMPIGALLGGFVAESAGLRTALIVTVIGLTSPLVWTFFSPIYALREMPKGPSEEARAAPHPGRPAHRSAPRHRAPTHVHANKRTTGKHRSGRLS